MSKKTPNKKISTEEMKEAIVKSGYLIEQRVELILQNKGYYVETNPVYKDSFTNKTREYDIFAIISDLLFEEKYDVLFSYIICECINNLQPLVFFTKDSPISFLFSEEVKCTGIPTKIWKDNKFIDLHKFIKMETFHHYCNSPIATQYCSFHQKKDKNSWMALHLEDQYHAFENIIQAIESEITKNWECYEIPKNVEKEKVNLSIFYPLLILQGDIYSCDLKNNKINLCKTNHIQYRKSTYTLENKRQIDYQIDIITESYLPRFLNILKIEMNRTKKALQNNETIIRTSTNKITEKIKKIYKKNKSFRELFENL